MLAHQAGLESSGQYHLKAKRPWNRNCDKDALRMAYGACADEDTTALKAVKRMTAWSFEALMEIKTKVFACLRDSQEEARLERWTSVSRTELSPQHTCAPLVTSCPRTILCVSWRETAATEVLGEIRLVPASIAPSVVAKARPKTCLAWFHTAWG